jgi:hypothetical protein
MIGHELTALYGLDHGQTLAVVFPATLRHQRARKAAKLLQYAARVWNITEGRRTAHRGGHRPDRGILPQPRVKTPSPNTASARGLSASAGASRPAARKSANTPTSPQGDRRNPALCAE